MRTTVGRSTSTAVKASHRAYRWAAGAVAAEVLAYLAWRPRMLHWGATEEEAAEQLPGDEVDARPRVRSTRAITIDAPPEVVWPWIVQMGIERAGFYSHDWVERLLGAHYVEGGHSATRIHPELQDLKVGDLIPYGAGASVPVKAIEPNRHLVHGESWVLRPLPGNRTRLIARYQGPGFVAPAVSALGPDSPPPARALHFVVAHVPGAMLLVRGFDFFVSDPLHHYMESGMLKGIKARAEGRLVAA